MIHIDEIIFEIIIPEILIDYLSRNNIKDVFIISDGQFILKENISEEEKNIILNACLHFISNEVGQYALDDENLMEEFNKIGSTIYFTDIFAKDLIKNGKIEVANKKLKEKIKEIYDFKIKLREEDNKKMGMR